MIRSFADQATEDVRIPPGNRLEALRGDRAGQHSIRINEQYRICFEWSDSGPKARDAEYRFASGQVLRHDAWFLAELSAAVGSVPRSEGGGGCDHSH